MERDEFVRAMACGGEGDEPVGVLAQDRTQQIHLGKAFVLAVGVVLVLVTVFTLNQLVQGVVQDLGQGL